MLKNIIENISEATISESSKDLITALNGLEKSIKSAKTEVKNGDLNAVETLVSKIEFGLEALIEAIENIKS